MFKILACQEGQDSVEYAALTAMAVIMAIVGYWYINNYLASKGVVRGSGTYSEPQAPPSGGS